MNQSKLGEAGSIGFWKHVISKDVDRIDVEPMEFEWKFSQDLLHW